MGCSRRNIYLPNLDFRKYILIIAGMERYTQEKFDYWLEELGLDLSDVAEIFGLSGVNSFHNSSAKGRYKDAFVSICELSTQDRLVRRLMLCEDREKLDQISKILYDGNE
jgi:hypothetical protein